MTEPPTMGQWLRGRFPASVDVGALLVEGRYVYSDGSRVNSDDLYRPRTEVWFERDFPDEAEVPGSIRIVHRDDRLLIIDKPPFLATIPRGQHVRQTVVARLRDALELPELQPVHRLDRLTSGLVALTIDRRWRGAYQTMFQRREVHKVYRALAVLPDGVLHDALLPDAPLGGGAGGKRETTALTVNGHETGSQEVRSREGRSREVRSRIEKSRGHWQAEEVPGAVNAVSRITLETVVDSGAVGPGVFGHGVFGPGAVVPGVFGHGALESAASEPGAVELRACELGAVGGIGEAGQAGQASQLGIEQSARVGVFRLEPETGRTHQLRVHMNSLGLPILGDPLYPVVREAWQGGPPQDDFEHPLQLLAAELSFVDPVDPVAGERHFESVRRLPIV